MSIFSITSESSKQTMEIAKCFASYLSKCITIILTGELGSGKTKFTEGILTYFGLEDEISSPTFNIVNEYSNNLANIYHFDVYRLSDIDEFYAIGGEEYFEKGICLIEWGELIEDALPSDYIKISLQKSLNEDNRTLTFETFGNQYKELLENFKLTMEGKII